MATRIGPGAPREVEGGAVERWFRWLAPLTLAALAIAAWDLVVRLKGIPPYILPGPGLVLASLIGDWAMYRDIWRGRIPF